MSTIYFFMKSPIEFENIIFLNRFFNITLQNIAENNSYVLKKFFLFSVVSYFFLEMNRYSDYGNDNPGHLYFFYLIYLILDMNKKYSLDVFFKKISLVAVFCFLNKPFFIFAILFPIYFWFKLKIYRSRSTYPLFSIIFLLVWLIKNILTTGCVLYPAQFTCLNSLPRYSNEAKFHIAARN